MFLVEIIFWCALLLAVYPYFTYPMLLSCLHLVAPRRASNPDDDYQPTVSIILAAYNEVRCIREKLENCLALDYPADKIVILVGSDGSEDGTNEIVAEFEDRGVRLFAFSPRRGKMSTVNRLVKQAEGEICVFSDISELFDRDAVRNLVRHFADERIGAVTGNHIYNQSSSGLGKGTSFYWKFQRFMQQIESRLSTICACDGTIYACRRELFPFPADHTINDDVAVPLGIISQGKRVIFEPKAIARGDVLTQTKRFFRQKVRSQAGKYQNFAQNRKMFLPWPPARFWIFVSHSVFPVLVPWFLTLVFIANAGLALFGDWSIYRYLFALQLTFYLLALLGWWGQNTGRNIPISSIPFYFVTANVGSLFGFFAYVTGVQRAAWRKVE